ncbi:DUF397 domain-containing protein [Streptomyces sp. HUAS TT20]|uniref:DUF397 domain-containing protein n=1 Tax=Streptomyces sp. HUAS TT20 TaxID=3447509 RepID=UPI0021D8E009|nr:DUF397 domain-containing protein [Streptomyces sp. HUAS 15-9]UXY26916.1 DUF397 domain-containing protein [Streptomyces sp. HUAS 15-9]
MSGDGLTWFKSSYSSGEGGECVEVAAASGAVYVRDSKDTSRPVLTVESAAWRAFIESVEL